MVDEIGFFLAEDFYWFNPSKLPSPIEWVNKRKMRVKDSINTVWWFSKTEWPKADITKVLTPYSDRMKKLLEDPAKFYTPMLRPSGHDISVGFSKGQTAVPFLQTCFKFPTPSPTDSISRDARRWAARAIQHASQRNYLSSLFGCSLSLTT